MGAIVSVTEREKRQQENTIITLDQAHQRMRIYQHRGNGEILVLVDDDISMIAGIRHTDWDLMKVNSKQQDYFRKAKIDIQIPAKNVNIIPSMKDALVPRSPVGQEDRKSEIGNHDFGNSSNTVLTPSGISTPSSSKNVALGNSITSSNGSSAPSNVDFEAGAKGVQNINFVESIGGITASVMSNENLNRHEYSSKPILVSSSTNDLFNPDERMKMTLTSLKAAAVSEHSARITNVKRSPRAPNLSSSVNSFSSFDVTECKQSSTLLTKSLFSDEQPRRKPGDRRRFDPRPYFPAAQKSLNDRSIEEINSQSQSWSQSVSQSLSQSAGAKDDGSTRSAYHSVASETLFSSGHLPVDVLNPQQPQQVGWSYCPFQSLLASLTHHQVQCKDCGRVFVGMSATEALRDHAIQCAERQIMSQAFEKTNTALIGDVQELSLLEPYELARTTLPRMVRSLDELTGRLYSYLNQISNIHHINANFATARRLNVSLLRLLADIERYISDVHTTLMAATGVGSSSISTSGFLNSSYAVNAGSMSGSSSENEAMAAMSVFRHLNALQVLAQRALQRLQDKVFVMEQCSRAIVGLQHFDFLRTVGKGGFGAVYIACRKGDRCAAEMSFQAHSEVKGDDNQLKELLSRTSDPGILTAAGVPLFAVKAMHGAAIRKHGATEQIMREKAVMAQASKYSDFFVRMLCSFSYQSYLFLAMEYCPGGDCLTLLNVMRKFPEIVAQHFIVQVCVAVQHLHLHGVVHRDIKPDNVLITARGHAKLGDFGLSVPYPAAAASAAMALLPPSSQQRPSSASACAPPMSTGSHSTSTSFVPTQTPRSTIQQAQRQQQQQQQQQQQPGYGSSQSQSRSTSLSNSSQLPYQPYYIQGSTVLHQPAMHFVRTNTSDQDVKSESLISSFLQWLFGDEFSLTSNDSTDVLIGSAPPAASPRPAVIQDSFSQSSQLSASQRQSTQTVGNSYLLYDPVSLQLQKLCQTQQATLELLLATPATPTEPQSSASHLPSTDSSSSLFFGHVANPGVPKLQSRVGNYFYSCPEIVVGTQYDHTVDYWAIAVMTFHFVTGCTPFEGEDKKATMDNIVTHNVQWSAVPRSISAECKCFIESILCAPQPHQRLGHRSAADVLGHSFFSDIDFSTLYEGYGPLFPQIPSVQMPFSQPVTTRSAASEDAKSLMQSGTTRFGLRADEKNGYDDTGSVESAAGAFPLFTMLGEEETADLPDFFDDRRSSHGHVSNMVAGQVKHTADLPTSSINGAATVNVDTDRDFECYTLYP